MDRTYNWLLNGDPSIAFLVSSELMNESGLEYQDQIGKVGWCAEYLQRRNVDGSWGRAFYQPKWTSTHYTLLELRNLRYNKQDLSIRSEVERIWRDERGLRNGQKKKRTPLADDVCVAGMYLNYASYFQASEEYVGPTVDYLLSQRMNDGGYNCELERFHATHSSLHTTVSVLEGFQSYLTEGHVYRADEIRESIDTCVQFILRHRLYRSSRTGVVIDEKFLRMTYPFRWKYTVLRAMNCFADLAVTYDPRMEEAMEYIRSKRTKDGLWKLQSRFSGNEYFEMEEVGKPSRMITFLALKVLGKYV